MKQLTTDIYKLLYRLTGIKYFSLAVALVYITMLNLITIQGLGLLLQDWLKTAKFLKMLFVFPYYIGTALLMLVINFLIMLPLKNLKKERQKKPVILPIVMYTLICFVLFLYIRYSAK